MKALNIILFYALVSCSDVAPTPQDTGTAEVEYNTPVQEEPAKKESPLLYNSGIPKVIQTGTTTPTELLAFANTLIGIPYKYGSTDPTQGFDCSGFITYVFNHFNIAVPRSSVDFTNVEREVPLNMAKPGDLVLFTGTDSTVRVAGHMGIINQAGSNGVFFIHSSSGKNSGVVVTLLNDYYMGRFIKIIRVFKQNDAG